MLSWLIRSILRFSAIFFFAMLSSVLILAVIGAQWFASLIGDSVVLVVEVLITMMALGLVAYFTRRADALARVVGTVRPGSPEEKQADRVLPRFDLAEKTLEFACFIFLPPAIAGFVLLDERLSMYLHGGLLVLAMVGAFWQSHRLEQLRALRGYRTIFGRTTP
ncbi:Transmembrane protein [Kosakonia sp. BK9b]